MRNLLSLRGIGRAGVSTLAVGAALLASVLLISCGPVVGQGNNNNHGGGDGGGTCQVGDIECVGMTARTCQSDGSWSEEVCESACAAGLGCVACVPGSFYCDEGHVMLCNENQELVVDHDCPPAESCILGECVDKCDPRVLTPSNVGCEFWAVDLDNEAVTTMGMSNDAAAQQFAVAIANNNDFDVQVDVTINQARVGEPVSEVQAVPTVTVPAHDLVRIDLPQREVDGCMGQNSNYVKGSGSGTFVSPHGFRIVATGPVVAYQFNPVIQQFSNDASILIPVQAIGNGYYVLGYPTANPCGISSMPQDSIPDHTSVTILGIHENTHVTVHPTHPIMASAGDSGFPIAETAAGGVLEFDIGPYDVVNLESLQPIGDINSCITLAAQQNGDFSGTRVDSSAPVAVFSSGERGLAGGEAPPPPDFSDSCCTDHLEQQMFPTTALGWNYAVSRSPVRSTGGYREPDIYRILATVDNTVVTTSLTDFPTFNLNAGELASFYSDHGFTVESQGGAIILGQFLVSMGYTSGGNGDSTFTIFPAVDQHRDQYVFLILDSFDDNYMVLAMPNTAAVSIDGDPVGEFPANCTIEDIGTLANIHYSQMTCLLPPGVHTVDSSEPVGLTVYGYYSAGSYGYPGGSDVRIINPVQ